MKNVKMVANLSRYSLEAQIDDIEQYTLSAGGQSIINVSKLKQAYEEEIKDASHDYILYLQDVYSEQYNFLINIQPNIFNKSAVVTLYTCLEHNLIEFCNLCQHFLKTNISVADFNGEGIFKAKRYLTKLMDIDFGTSQEWEFMTQFNKLRNCIVHANGVVKKGTQNELMNYIKKSPTLSLNQEINLIISMQYLTEVIHNIRVFFQWLYKKLENFSK